MAYGDIDRGPLGRKRHPIRGALWGIPFGLGLALVLVSTTVIPLDLMQIVIVMLVGVALGVVWGMYGPAKRARGIAPPAPPVAGSEAAQPGLAGGYEASITDEQPSTDQEATTAEEPTTGAEPATGEEPTV